MNASKMLSTISVLYSMKRLYSSNFRTILKWCYVVSFCLTATDRIQIANPDCWRHLSIRQVNDKNTSNNGQDFLIGTVSKEEKTNREMSYIEKIIIKTSPTILGEVFILIKIESKDMVNQIKELLRTQAHYGSHTANEKKYVPNKVM